MITTYDELKLAVADWLDREDLTGQIPDFIQLAEAQIQRQLRRKTVRAELVISAQYSALPADCAELRSLHIPAAESASDTRLIRIVSPAYLVDFKRTFPTAGVPRYASIVGQELTVVPAPAASYDAEILYFQNLVPLSASNTTNAVLTENPDVYVFGALKEAAPYLEHDARAAMWEAKYDRAIAEINKVREREEYGAAPIMARKPMVTF